MARLALLALLSAVVLGSVAPARTRACSCAMFPHEVAVERFDAAFRGRVTQIAREGEDEVVTFEVVEIYRGVEAGTRSVRVRRFAGIAPCFIPTFERERVYRVYAARSPNGLRVGYCNPSAPVER